MESQSSIYSTDFNYQMPFNPANPSQGGSQTTNLPVSTPQIFSPQFPVQNGAPASQPQPQPQSQVSGNQTQHSPQPTPVHQNSSQIFAGFEEKPNPSQGGSSVVSSSDRWATIVEESGVGDINRPEDQNSVESSQASSSSSKKERLKKSRENTDRLVVLDLGGIVVDKVKSHTRSSSPTVRSQESGVKSFDTEAVRWTVRPGATEFIQWLLTRYRVCIWSAAQKKNVKQALKVLGFNPSQFVAVLTRDDCLLIPSETVDGPTPKFAVYKSLSVMFTRPCFLRRWNFGNTVIVDDTDYKVRLNPMENNIVVDPQTVDFPTLQARVQYQLQIVSGLKHFTACKPYTLGRVLIDGHPGLDHKRPSTPKTKLDKSVEVKSVEKKKTIKKKVFKNKADRHQKTGPTPFFYFLQANRAQASCELGTSDEKIIKRHVLSHWTKMGETLRQEWWVKIEPTISE